MTSMRARTLSILSMAALLAVVSLSTYADNGSPSATAGVKTPPEPLTVGRLAGVLVNQVALNSPKGGFSDRSALGIMGAVGFNEDRAADSVATVADLKAMLSTLGIETTTQNPNETLTTIKLSATLDAVRSTLPRFSVPISDPAKSRDSLGPDGGGDDGNGRPGPCEISFLACKNRCQERSPSGTGGHGIAGCIQECQKAHHDCDSRMTRFHPEGH